MLQCAESGWLQSVSAALRIEIVGFLLTPQTNCFLLAVALAFGVLDCRVVFELYTGLKILSCLCALNLFYCNYVCGLPICHDRRTSTLYIFFYATSFLWNGFLLCFHILIVFKSIYVTIQCCCTVLITYVLNSPVSDTCLDFGTNKIFWWKPYMLYCGKTLS